jgi:hypothetical protein
METVGGVISTLFPNPAWIGFSQDKSARTARTTNKTALPIFCITLPLSGQKQKALLIYRKETIIYADL